MWKQRGIEDVTYLIKMACVYLGLILVLFAVSGPIGEILQEREAAMAAKEEVVASAVLEFAGMQQLGQFPAEVEVFFLGLMILNLIAMGVALLYGISGMRASYEKSGFGFFFMQIMPLWKNYLFAVIRILIIALLSWGTYMIIASVIAGILTSGMDVSVADAVQSVLGTMGGRGTMLVFFMTAIGILFGTNQRHRMHGSDFSLCLMGFSFVLGNLYKIPQYIGYTQIQEMVNAQETMAVVNSLKGLRIVCPFSWLNPFNIYNDVLDANLLWLYVVIACLVLALTAAWYCMRDWREV